MTRGIKRDVDELVKFLETRALNLPFVDKNGKEGLQPIQGNLQPIQLWSYVFPEFEKDAVLTSLKFDEANIKRWSDGRMKYLISALRVALNAEKIPEFDKSKKLYLPLEAMENISIVPIGIKKDVIKTDPKGNTHEAI